MPRTVTTSEAENQLSSVMSWAEEHRDGVEEAMALADRFVREVIDDMAREGKIRFERDRP